MRLWRKRRQICMDFHCQEIKRQKSPNMAFQLDSQGKKGTGKLYLTSPPPLFMMREPIKYYNGDTKYASYCQDDHKG